MFPDEYQYTSGEVCKDDRDQNSVLCGQCKPGYTVLFGSENCSSSCTDLWVWAPIVFGFLIVNCLVLSFSPNLASGHLNVCLYSYQIMKILTPEGFEFDPGIEFLAALSNFQLGIGRGFCLSSGLDNADKLMIMVNFPVVEIVILLLVKAALAHSLWGRGLQKIKNKLLCNPDNPGDPADPGTCCCRTPFRTYLNCCSESFNGRVRNGFTRAFCTIIVLCYVDITHISLQLLHPVTVGKRTVLFADATYVPAGPLKSALLQFFCILFLVIIAVVRPYKEANEAGEAQRVATQGEAGEAQGEETQGEAGEAQGEETQGEAGEAQGVATQFEAGEAQGVATQGGNEAGEAPRVATQGGNEAGEAQGVANQGGDEEQEAGEKTVENKWINESDTIILATLSAIAILSSPTGSDVSDSTRSGLMWPVRILAWVPLVMACRPALRYLSQCCKAKDNHVPERERTQQRGVPNDQDPNVNERAPLLGGAQQRGVPNEPDRQINQLIPVLDADEFYTAPEQPDVPNGPDGDLQVNLQAAWNKTIYVSPSGNDSQGCGHWAKPCKSLDTAFTIAFNGGGSANSTLISAAKGNYTLAKSFNITNVDTFALVGQGSRSDETTEYGVTRTERLFTLRRAYWAGKVKDEFGTYLCPADYCNFKKPMFPDEYQYISGEMCKGDRNQTSVLCGQCKPGYTVLFGSENCSSSCTDLWAWAPIVVGLLIVNCFVLSFRSKPGKWTSKRLFYTRIKS
ncbi:DNA polymerase delta catalytic subunit [Desmophyllum pertusum]|uniref:DNA polymerase delta catalytic subunit n=1 Tax=Desmophyllum pertusum TaxID=174260 RepID=A0A9X0CMV1_9CNID|nr:DNA polymerase delta catalytic subunit [Desmophyllum pertusum]